MNPLKPVSISLSPNTEKDDVWLAFKLIFRPWKWVKGEAIEDLESRFRKYLGVKYAFSFNSGRSALMAVLKSLNLNHGDNVLIQAFTCNAVSNPVIWNYLKPIYIDVDENTFNIDLSSLEKRITPRSRAVIVQHTFGLPANIDKLLVFCKERNLILIEDCAHSLGATHRNKKIGTFGKVSFFSFSRDKVISSVYGGMVATNDAELAQKIKEFQEDIGYPPLFWVKQQLLHPVLMNSLILPTYRLFGKYLLVFFQMTHILSKAVHWKEKRGLKPGYFPKRMPNALAILALNQLKKLDRFNSHRKRIAEFYFKELQNSNFKIISEREKEKSIFLRFSVQHPRAREIIKKAWASNLLIGDWYDKVIAPRDTRLKAVQYDLFSCPKAENLARKTLNLPTHINISIKEAGKVIAFLKKWK